MDKAVVRGAAVDRDEKGVDVSDIKHTRIEYLLALEQSEFNLVFRAVGKACGAKVGFKTNEMDALRKLNHKLASARLAAAKQALEVAEGAHVKALELMQTELPPESDPSSEALP